MSSSFVLSFIFPPFLSFIAVLQYKHVTMKAILTPKERCGRKTATEQHVNVYLVKLSVQQWSVVFSDVYLDHSQEILIRADVTPNVLVSVDFSATTKILGIVADLQKKYSKCVSRRI